MFKFNSCSDSKKVEIRIVDLVTIGLRGRGCESKQAKLGFDGEKSIEGGSTLAVVFLLYRYKIAHVAFYIY